ncbi:hypothetical protein RDI58_024338 [Solanum bulbocastanum]|uniref:Uncharacterized protein n=1 Tax=Solanum bulbocastanum TaxID=147425 RepID=A0AAN8SXG9_SOLBU
MLKAITQSYAGTKDKNTILAEGLIEKDDYGFTLVNFNHLLYRRLQL